MLALDARLNGLIAAYRLITDSPGHHGRNQKHVGVFSAKHQNLHTGTVFDAERRGKSHSAKKSHGPLKKCIFLKKIQEKLR